MAESGSRSRYSSPQAGFEDVRQRAMQSYEAVHSYVESNPWPAVMMAFGLGLSVGLLVGSQIVRVPEPTLYEKIGKQVYDVLGGVLPESLAAHLRS